MNKDLYRPITSDYEYINNWVEKWDLICEPKEKIGFLGSCFFIGIIIAIYFVPKWADEHGRLKYILQAFGWQIVIQIGFIVATDIY